MAPLSALLSAASLLSCWVHASPIDEPLGQFLSTFGWLPDLVTGLLTNPSAPQGLSFRPKATTTWNIELISVPKVSQADDKRFDVWNFDLFDAPESTISAFKAKGHPVICYFSAGSREEWRSDASEFPQKAIGNGLSGWAGEEWIDTRNRKVRNIMKERIALAARKGCNGVDPDNIDAYTNANGLGLTKADAVDYVRFLARTAHSHGLSFGLKNGGDIVQDVVDVAQWAINEQCVQYNECHLHQPFIEQNKPVFHIEYTEKKRPGRRFVKKSCNDSGAKGFSTVIKHMDLNTWTKTCP